jgi:hypothetical protein
VTMSVRRAVSSQLKLRARTPFGRWQPFQPEAALRLWGATSSSVNHALGALGYDLTTEHGLRTAHHEGEFEAANANGSYPCAVGFLRRAKTCKHLLVLGDEPIERPPGEGSSSRWQPPCP